VIENGLKPARDGKIAAELLPGAGFIAHLSPPKKFAGWK